MILADTDVLIDALHGREPSCGRISLELATGRLATTTITVYELHSGVKTEKQRKDIATLLEAMTILPLDSEAARRAADIRRALEAMGQGIATADYLIAGVALSKSAILLTRNQAHFGRVPGLSLGTLSPPS
ncbi:MAG: type II toxin-antitoxin system VapC family toxin [Candidatus Eremiobacterota bacterium]